jgi:hypothetical protein
LDHDELKRSTRVGYERVLEHARVSAQAPWLNTVKLLSDGDCNRDGAASHNRTGAKKPQCPIAWHNRRRNVGGASPNAQSQDEFADTLGMLLQDRASDTNSSAPKTSQAGI